MAPTGWMIIIGLPRVARSNKFDVILFIHRPRLIGQNNRENNKLIACRLDSTILLRSVVNVMGLTQA